MTIHLPFVSLIIPTYNRSDVLCDTLRMALDQSYSSYEVIVVDQSPIMSRELRSVLESAGDRVQYIRLPAPNLPAARNAGIRASSGDVVVFIDDDVKIGPDYLSLHVRHFSDPRVGAVMGVIVDRFDEEADAYLELARHKVSHHLTPAVMARTDARLGLWSVDWVVGGNTSFRRSAVIQAGMCDERFGGTGWCEDADLSVRLNHLGYDLLLDTGIKLIHLALVTGGCTNRDPDTADRREREHTELYLFFIIKNRKLLSWHAHLRGLRLAYRRYVLNRAVVSHGLFELWRRHWQYAAMVGRAWRGRPLTLASQHAQMSPEPESSSMPAVTWCSVPADSAQCDREAV
jgi:glycosyltransferase involved in cell wall biosynthesis